jgi:predicted transposase YdaD
MRQSRTIGGANQRLRERGENEGKTAGQNDGHIARGRDLVQSLGLFAPYLETAWPAFA